ncbi:glutaredoxin [Rhodotorula sphaerocarpa]
MTTRANYHRVETPSDLQAELSTDLNRVSVLYFRADWAEPCKTMDGVTDELAKRWPDVLFLSIEAEALPDISESFEVDAVPYFILLRGHTLLTRLSGAQPAALSAALKSHAAKPSALSSSSRQPVAAKTTYKPGEQPVTGAPSAQGTVGAGAEDEEVEESEEELAKRCGFSQKIVGILESEHIEYTTFDILQDEGVRQKLKEMNEWPTFPQLIIKGEFVGGLDVVQEMREAGELQDLVGSSSVPS